jgi:hypothetical protein
MDLNVHARARGFTLQFDRLQKFRRARAPAYAAW